MTDDQRQRDCLIGALARALMREIHRQQPHDRRPHHRLEDCIERPDDKQSRIGPAKAHRQIADRCARNANKHILRRVEMIDHRTVDQLPARIDDGKHRLKRARPRHGKRQVLCNAMQRRREIHPSRIGGRIHQHAGQQNSLLQTGKSFVHSGTLLLHEERKGPDAGPQ